MTDRELLKAIAERLSCPKCSGSGTVIRPIHDRDFRSECTCVQVLREELDRTIAFDNRVMP